MLTAALLVSTYERPDALATVLQSVLRQSEKPHELLIADDGSGETTRVVIERFAASVPYPVVHVRHEHDGFRAGRIRNLAVARTTADYVVQVDGDMVLHEEFVADHRRAARHGCYVQGTRVMADEILTQRLMDGQPHALTPFSPGLGGLRRLYAARLPNLSRAVSRLANGFIAIKGCNLAYWRGDFARVAGYNEKMTGWGSEDKELAARLGHAGVQRRTLLFAGIAWHLHHPPAARDRHAINEEILARTRRERRVRWDR